MGGPGSGDKAKQIELADDREAYEQQPRESDKAYHAFRTYLNQARPRVCRRVPEQLGKKAGYLSTVESWSKRFGWRQRARAWDAELDAKGREAELEEVAAMRRRHVRVAASLVSIGRAELRKLKKLAKTDEGRQVAVKDLTKLVEAGIKLERLVRGEPETVTAQTTTHKISVDETRDSMRKLLSDPSKADAIDKLLEAANGDAGSSDADR